MGKKEGSKVQGEGDYEGARRYDDATRKFVTDGKVASAAAKAKPATAAEKESLEAAERAGKARAKEEDPLLKRQR